MQGFGHRAVHRPYTPEGEQRPQRQRLCGLISLPQPNRLSPLGVQPNGFVASGPEGMQRLLDESPCVFRQYCASVAGLISNPGAGDIEHDLLDPLVSFGASGDDLLDVRVMAELRESALALGA